MFWAGDRSSGAISSNSASSGNGCMFFVFQEGQLAVVAEHGFEGFAEGIANVGSASHESGKGFSEVFLDVELQESLLEFSLAVAEAALERGGGHFGKCKSPAGAGLFGARRRGELLGKRLHLFDGAVRLIRDEAVFESVHHGAFGIGVWQTFKDAFDRSFLGEVFPGGLR